MKTTYDAVNEFNGQWYGSKDKVYICDTGVITDYDQFNDLASQMETNFGKCKQSYSDYKFDYHLSPEPIPAYTQAMADNGELPSVGMEIIARYMHDSKTVTHKGIVLFISDCRVIMGNDTGDHHFLLGDYRCEPLTPPIELIDGKAYQFELCFGDYRVGYYCSVRNSFFDGLLKSHKICGKAEATNIQPLTVEVK